MERLKIIANSSSLPQLGEGAVLNHYKNLKFTLLHVFAVGTVLLFPPYNCESERVHIFPLPTGEGACRAGEGAVKKGKIQKNNPKFRSCFVTIEKTLPIRRLPRNDDFWGYSGILKRN